MLVKKKNQMYTNKRKYVQGSGFVNDIGSYILQNKDLIAKPLLGAVGNIGAMTLTEGSKFLINKLMKPKIEALPQLDEKSKQIIEGLKRGSEIKTF
jgi:hypothetical protein